MIERLPCGCRHDGREWTFVCEPCMTEHDERHARAAADYREQETRRTRGPIETRYL